MNKFILSLCLIFISGGFLCSQNINGRFSSSVYSLERFDTTNVSNNYLRAYELLSLNINQDNFSLRTYFDFEGDLSGDAKEVSRARLYNLYLEGRSLFDIATIKLGRQPIFNSIGGGVYDGANLELNVEGFRLSGYYGGDVPSYQKFAFNDWQNNFITGGKLTTTAIDNFQISLSYVNKNFKPQDYYALRLDPENNPINVLISHNSNQFSFGSAEVFYNLKNVVDIQANYDYDFNFEKTSKFALDADYLRIDDLKLNLYYNYRDPRINYNSIFSVFNYGNTQEIEVGGDYTLNKDITLSGKIGDVVYQDDNSQRITLGLSTIYGTLTYLKNLGYAGEMDAVSLYTARSFLEGLLTPSAGISYTSYKLSPDDPRNNLTSILAGINVRPYRALSFDLQGQYMDNKIYRNDFRFFFKINYWFNTNLGLM
ncbi:MAG: hypothetical protein P4L35_01645 [Ignavibacteriaceae bacterium]|nr:hypothetical protein [Ignavibacteriaceae bacterium]